MFKARTFVPKFFSFCDFSPNPKETQARTLDLYLRILGFVVSFDVDSKLTLEEYTWPTVLFVAPIH